MSYARARLWLGISGVGTLVILCLVALVLQVPARLLSDGARPAAWRDGSELATVLLLYAVVQGGFDLFGGFILPTEYSRAKGRIGTFLVGWARGVVCHSAVLLIVGLLMISAARAGGFWATMSTFLAVSAFLLFAQAGMASIVGGVSYRGGDAYPNALPMIVAHSTTPYFTGGIVGLPGFERLILPVRWRDDFSEEQQKAFLLRKAGMVRTGSRARGLLLALAFNTIGFAISCRLAGGTADVAGMVTTSLYFTIWSFLGLLLLPIPSQNAVFRADSFALTNGASNIALTQVIHRLDADQDDEPARPDGVERFFHPVPSVERRLARLSSPVLTNRLDAWHTARTAIYLSWAGMSLLSRAVHCNAGRPDAWVFLPSD